MASTTSTKNMHTRRKSKRSPLFLLLGTFIVLAAGILTLLWQVGQAEKSRADAGSVVGPPTLTGSVVNQIFARLGSPMVGTGAIVEQAARNANIDDAFALAVWWTETNDGAAGVGNADLNPGSVRGASGYPAAFDGYTIYPSYTAAINDWFTLLRARYVNRGLTSAYTICYPYVGTTGAAAWAAKVVNLMLHYHGQSSTSAAPILTSAAPVVPAAPLPTHLVGRKSVPVTHVPVNNSQRHGTGRAQAPIRKLHRPVIIGQSVASNSRQTIQKVPPATQRNVTGIFTAHVQQVLVILALLAALLVILPGLRLKWGKRKHMPLLADERITGSLEETGFPPLYFNEYSPLTSGTQSAPGMPQSAFRETGALARDEVTQMVPATPLLSAMGTVPLTPFTASRRAGEATLRRARLVPVGSTSANEDIQTRRMQERATEVIGIVPRRPGEAAPPRQKEQVTPKSQIKNS